MNSIATPPPPSDPSEMSRLDALRARAPLPTWRLFAWPVMTFLAMVLAWSAFARLDEVAVASGEVVPQGRVKLIQHLEGGIIEEILVTDGASVKAGDPLVRLDLATAGVNRNELQAHLDGELLRRARLIAEMTATDLAFPAEAAERHSELAAAERQAFSARAKGLASSLAVIGERVRQKELEVEELSARYRAVEKNFAIARERLAVSESLVADGLTSRMEHLQLRSEVESLRGELETLVAAIPRAKAAVAEAKERVIEAQSGFRQKTQESLGDTEQRIAQLRERLQEATDQGLRAEIRSPIDGVVKRLRYNTIGGVISPGEPIMEIVPTGDRLVVEARLNPVDRGYVSEGQRAVVKITTYDFVRYGGLDGIVSQVAPDATTDPDGNPYFRVVVETEKSNLGDGASLPISPGMQATVDIHTGSRTVLAYLIKPVLKLRHEAFRER